jgi:translation initiation factor IF-3
MKKKDKAKKATQKARVVKEIFIGAGIDPHDLGTKMNHAKEFLSNGHPVRIVVVAKKQNLKDNPMAVEEVTLKILESIEKFVSSVQQPTQSPMRSEFLLNPKSTKQSSKSQTAPSNADRGEKS